MSEYSSHSDRGRGPSPLITSSLVFALILTMFGGGFAAWKLYHQREAARLAQIAQQLGQQLAQQNNPPPPPEEGQPPEATETWRQFTRAWHVSKRNIDGA